MKIKFLWIKSDELFDPTIHNREDEKIFHLEIGQKEGGYARARIVIQNPGHGLLWPKDKQYAVISFDDEPVFKGRLIAMPSQIKGELVTLELTAIIDESKKTALCQEIKDKGTYDRLFFSDEPPQLSDLLQAYTALPYWNRITGELALSDIFKGKQHLNLAGNFFRDSLTVTIAQEPLTEVNVQMKAEWLQQARGAIEIGHHIKKACPKGYLSSLNGQSLEQSWWNKQDAMGQNGYRIENSQLQQIKPLDKTQYPSTSNEFWHLDEKPKKVQFSRSWYDLQLRLGWSYKQKRREIATFKLKHNVQDICGGGSRSKTLTFALAAILGRNHHWEPNHIYTPGFQVLHDDVVYKCLRRHQSRAIFNPRKWVRQNNHVHVDGQAARAEFFTTIRGEQAVAYALEVAKAHLAASARCINVRIKAHLNDLKNITLDHNLSIQDPRLPGGSLKGKVIGYRFIADGQSGERTAEVKLGVSIGTGISITGAFAQESPYAEEDVLEENIGTQSDLHSRSPSSICFSIPDDRPAPMGISRPSLLSERDLIQSIEIFNDADKQNRRLLKRQYPHSNDMKTVLKEMPTDIRIKLKDLITYGCLDHAVKIDVLTAWSAPQHINLSASTNT